MSGLLSFDPISAVVQAGHRAGLARRQMFDADLLLKQREQQQRGEQFQISTALNLQDMDLRERIAQQSEARRLMEADAQQKHQEAVLAQQAKHHGENLGLQTSKAEQARLASDQRAAAAEATLKLGREKWEAAEARIKEQQDKINELLEQVKTGGATPGIAARAGLLGKTVPQGTYDPVETEEARLRAARFNADQFNAYMRQNQEAYSGNARELQGINDALNELAVKAQAAGGWTQEMRNQAQALDTRRTDIGITMKAIEDEAKDFKENPKAAADRFRKPLVGEARIDLSLDVNRQADEILNSVTAKGVPMRQAAATLSPAALVNMVRPAYMNAHRSVSRFNQLDAHIRGLERSLEALAQQGDSSAVGSYNRRYLEQKLAEAKAQRNQQGWAERMDENPPGSGNMARIIRADELATDATVAMLRQAGRMEEAQELREVQDAETKERQRIANELYQYFDERLTISHATAFAAHLQLQFPDQAAREAEIAKIKQELKPGNTTSRRPGAWSPEMELGGTEEQKRNSARGMMSRQERLTAIYNLGT